MSTKQIIMPVIQVRDCHYVGLLRTFQSRYEAIAAERKIKGWSHAKKQALIHNDFERIRILSKRSKNRCSSFVTARSWPPLDERI